LFCHGFPGAGKTIITSIVINYLQTDIQKHSKQNQEENFAIAFVYCDFQQRAQQKPVGILASLLKQLIQKLPSVPESVKLLHKEHKNNTSASCPNTDISKALQSVASDYARVFIVIDALDEFQDSKSLLPEIFKLQSNTGANLFITSRPEKDIQKEFQGSIPLEIRARHEDLKKYIDRRTLDLDIFQDEDKELKEEIRVKIKNKVTDAVNGM